MDLALKIGLIAVYTAFLVLRIRYQLRAKRAGLRAVIEESKKYSVLLGALICYKVGTFFLYLLWPQTLDWAAVLLPAWLRWCGLALALAALALFAWVHRHLGSNFSMRLHIADRQTLTQTGPHRWVRHPMYSAFLLLHVAAFLLTANWFMGVTWLAGLVAVIALRVRREEAMMLEYFGAEYEDYRRRTGVLIPPLWPAPLRVLGKDR